MIKHILILLISFSYLICPKSMADNSLDLLHPASAQRNEQVDWSVYEKNFRQNHANKPTDLNFSFLVTALDQKNKSKQNWDYAPDISADSLKKYFELTRDEKILKDTHGRARRATWLYPDDGCYARAEIVAQIIEKSQGRRPAKIFAFGNLNAQTVNHPDGYVTWWYHVAALYKSENTYYVLDPAINSSQALSIDNWLKSISPDQAPQISVCSTFAYDPSSPCSKSSPQKSHSATSDDSIYLDMEWERIQELHRSPENELGDLPPWKNKN